MDGEISYKDLKDNLQSDNNQPKVVKDGKVQLYFKGTVAGNYLVTASLDTEREDDDLYRNLDPDASYGVYGDNSSVGDLTREAYGPLYLLVEKDLSWAKWGQLRTAIDNNQLASFNRSLQGGQVHYESSSTTTRGVAMTQIDAFQATAHQKSARVEYSSTGSSVYYLKHQQVVRDSLRVRAEVRDSVSGNVRSSRLLRLGDDYQLHGQTGRITLNQPLDREVESTLLMASENGAVDNVYMIVDYNYSIVGDWSQGMSGAEIKQALGDHMVVGATYIEEQKQSSDYVLEGVNSTIYWGDNHDIHVEYAKSTSRAEPRFYSTDGGLSWQKNADDSIVDEGSLSGDGISIRGVASLSEGRTDLNYYARKITSGFSSGQADHIRGKRAVGFDIGHRFDDSLSMRLEHHRQALAEDKGDDQETTSSTIQVAYDLTDRLMLTGELMHRTAAGKDTGSFALQGRYQISNHSEISLTQQSSISGGQRSDACANQARR